MRCIMFYFPCAEAEKAYDQFMVKMILPPRYESGTMLAVPPPVVDLPKGDNDTPTVIPPSKGEEK